MKKKIKALIVDGKEYTIADDNKYIEGRKKTRTIEEFRKKKGEMIPIFVVPPDEYDVVYGFSSEVNHKEWLIENKLHKNYDREQKMLEKARLGPSPSERERIKKDVQEATEKFGKILKEHNLKVNEFDKIEKLKENPYFSSPFHSVVLYDRRFHDPGGAYVVLPGNPCTWGYYPNLGDYNFNNITSSIKMDPCSKKVWFWDGINYTHAHLEIIRSELDLTNFWFWFGLWNNKISSAIVF